MPPSAARRRFAELHQSGHFVLANAWDAGSARIVQAAGFAATATTSSGHAASLGRHDQQVTRDELLEHVAALVAAVDIPVSVDAEHCFATDPAGVAETVGMVGETGAAGISFEDYVPGTGTLPFDQAVGLVAAAGEAARGHGMVLTARCENLLYGRDDLDEVVARLRAYRDAGADVLYAPGLRETTAVRRVVAETGAPVNVLLLPGGPTVAELAAAGARRISVGGALAFVAYGAAGAAARELAATGRVTAPTMPGDDRRAAFGG